MQNPQSEQQIYNFYRTEIAVSIKAVWMPVEEYSLVFVGPYPT